MEQLIAHAIGDYCLQSDWMAAHKRNSFLTALMHAGTYSLPFVAMFDVSFLAWLVIMLSHAVIDHLGLARYVCFAKNFLAPKSQWPKWGEVNFSGYSAKKPLWMSTWLFILTDNTMHLAINYAALRWL